MNVVARLAAAGAPLAAALMLAASAGAAVLLGDQTVEAKTDYNAAGLAEAFRTTAAATGTVSLLTVYVDATSTATAIVAGLYSDNGGHPGTLLGQGTLQAPVGGGWNSIAIGAASVTSGAAYWIAVAAPAGAGTLRFRDACCGGGSPAETSAQTALSTLPASWATGGAYRDGPLSAYGSSATTPALVVSPTTLSFSGAAGGASPAPAILSISNGGGGTLSWSASSGTSSWLSVQPTVGTAPASATVTASTTGLAAGTYSGVVTVDAGSAQGSPASVPVTLKVTTSDTTPPSVSLTAPATGATVTGTTTVTATASDDVGVVGVQLKLDGAALGPELTAAPYTESWDTATVTDGQHTLTAVARDAAGNTATSSPVTVTVQNTAQSSPTLLAGDQALEPSADSNPAGAAEAFRTTAPASGTVTQLDAYLDTGSAATTVAVGLYTDNGGHPGLLLASGTIAAPVAGTWNSVSVPPVGVTAGAVYWIALLGNGGTIRFRDRCCGSGSSSETAGQTGLAVLPSAWTSGGSYHDGPLSAYAAGAGPTLPPADQVGRWSAPFAWPGVAVHAALLPTGNVITWDGFAAGPNSEELWNPASGTFTATPYGRNLFCAGQTLLADGRLLVLGGHNAVNDGLFDTTLYDPFTNSWTRGPDMTDNRWYPTVTTLPDGRALVVAGDNITENTSPPYAPLSITNNTLPEIYDPRTSTYQDLASARLATTYYPFMLVLPDGRIFDAGPDTQSRILDPATWTWSLSAVSSATGASAVMYRPGKVMKSGTWSDPDFKGMPVGAQTQVIDMTQASPAWRSTASMAFARAYEDLTVLPDGNVLATGGSSASEGVDITTAVLPAELWNASTETWSTMTAEQNGRMYHSVALLLPDARVLVAGGGQLPGSIAVNQTNAEIFSPPYLFRGPRPSIASAPSLLQYGASFTVSTPDAASIAQVSLVRLGAVTHAFDQDQRFVPLSFSAGSGALSVQAPSNGNVAPPGYYMLFVVNGSGVPSTAAFVRLPAPSEDTQPPSAPSGLTASGGIGSIGLSWSASTDNVGVAKYAVYRSTTQGFTPSVVNRVAYATGTSYADAGLAAGTYYYRVTALDAAGNESAPSPEASGTASADTTPPTVAITAPSSGATVSGQITVTASASDDVGVAGVAFQLDGAPLGSTVASAPYTLTWDTSTVANGQHTLTAVAHDAAGNTATSPPVAVTVQNTAQLPPTLLAGDQTVEPSGDYNAAGTAEAFRTSAAATGTTGHLSVYLDGASTAASVQVGLYADNGGHPGALLTTATIAAPKAGAWNTVAAPAASVTAGTTYWIAILGSGGTVRFRDRCCVSGAGAETSGSTSLAALPATWASGTSYRDGPASGYAAT